MLRCFARLFVDRLLLLQPAIYCHYRVRAQMVVAAKCQSRTHGSMCATWEGHWDTNGFGRGNAILSSQSYSVPSSGWRGAREEKDSRVKNIEYKYSIQIVQKWKPALTRTRSITKQIASIRTRQAITAWTIWRSQNQKMCSERFELTSSPSMNKKYLISDLQWAHGTGHLCMSNSWWPFHSQETPSPTTPGGKMSCPFARIPPCLWVNLQTWFSQDDSYNQRQSY